MLDMDSTSASQLLCVSCNALTFLVPQGPRGQAAVFQRKPPPSLLDQHALLLSHERRSGVRFPV